MYSILKILLGLKLTLLLLILCAGTGIVFDNSGSVDFETINISYDFEIADLELKVPDPEQIVPAAEIVDKTISDRSCSKPSSLSELGLYIEL